MVLVNDWRVVEPSANAFVQYAFVDVADCIVLWIAVNDCKVDEPVTRSCPPIFENAATGSNQNSAVVVEFEPIVITSVSFRE